MTDERTDAERVHRVVLEYAAAIDTKDWQRFRDVFTADATMIVGSSPIVGRETLARHMQHLHEPLDASLHRISNVVVEVTADRATAVSYLDAVLVRRGHPGGETFDVIGTYHDELVRHDGRWAIERRTFTAIHRRGNAAVLAPPADS